jgi:acetate kinase
MRVLVFNSGSSSIKYKLFDMHDVQVIASGSVERIGENEGMHRHQKFNCGEVSEDRIHRFIYDHREGLSIIGTALNKTGAIENLSELFAIGHRVVHGGEYFREPTLIDEDVVRKIRELVPLAPLHNPANLMGIEVALLQVPEVPQVAVFDTAFHQTIPEYAYRYALPDALYNKHRIRRYGFHGTSHHYVARCAADYLEKPLETLRLITLHLGNGASAAAIAYGNCVDTSMGMTPVEGLIMGTRCGDIDPMIHFFLERTGMSTNVIEEMLNRDSGLEGICGANDMREVHELADSGDSRAKLALEMYCYRIRKYIGAYSVVLGGLDAVIFTGGVGENDAWVRARCCEKLEILGIVPDDQKNHSMSHGLKNISQDNAAVAVLVVPTNEELEIALQTVSCVPGTSS